MARLLVAGESLVDLVVNDGSSEARVRPGGSPMNVAVGLGRLGHDVTLMTRIGDDAYGEAISKHVAAAGVRLASGSVVPGGRTSTASARIGPDGSAEYDFELDSSLAVPPGHDELLDGVDIVHVGSIATWLQPGAGVLRSLTDAAARRGALVSYDPNVRPALVGSPAEYVESVRGWAAAATVFKASEEDMAYITGHGGETGGWTDSSTECALIVVTRGREGASARVGDRWIECAARTVEIVDTIGAGDSFMSALLDGLSREALLSASAIDGAADEALARVVTRASVAAGITCSREGADPPTLSELEAALQLGAGP
jgi:fructokinase